MATKKHIVLLLVFLLLLISKISYSQNQNYDVEFITTKDGLANGCIQEIIQDSKGFMWFATEGGLNRYDGYNIKLYDCDQKFINTVFEDPADSGKVLWVGTRGGLFKFDTDNETFLRFKHDPNDPSSISNDGILCIYKDRSGVYWVGTGDGGLNKFDRATGKFISYKNNPNDPTSISSNTVFTVCEDYLGYLWVGTFLGGLERFDRITNKFIHYKYDPYDPHTLFSNHIYSLFEDEDKTLWIGTSATLYRYDRKNNKFVRHILIKNNKSFFIWGSVFSMVEDKQKTLWVASNGQGVLRIDRDRKNFNLFSEKLNTLESSSVFVDNSGILWVGTFCQGINKIIPKRKIFNHYNSFNSSNQKFSWTYSFYEDNDKNLWIGTSEGLMKSENEKIIRYPIINNAEVHPIFHIYQLADGKLLLSGSGVLFELDLQTGKYNTYSGKYIIYPSEVIDLYKKLVKESVEIVCINKVKNNQDIVKEFELQKTTNVFIYSTGEGDLEKLSDYGWITTDGDKNIIWKMEPAKTRYIEGSDRESIVSSTFINREQIALLELKPGKYRLHYHSNNAHSYGNWVNNPPPNPEFWGIVLLPVNVSVYKKYKSEIDKIAYHKLHWGDLYTRPMEDDKGRLWFALSTEKNSIHIFDRIHKQFIPVNLTVNGEPLLFTDQIIKDKKGNLWFSSAYDVRLIRKNSDDKCEIKFDLHDFVKDKKASLNNDAISIIYLDNKDNIWIGSDLGLFKYNLTTEKINQFKFSEFTFPNTIEGIIEDDYGDLWISTSSNIIKFNPDTKVIRKFEAADGLSEMKFALYSSYRLRNGSLLFGGSDGFIMFHPDSINDNNVVPQLAITNFKIFEKLVSIGNMSSLKKSAGESHNIV